MAGRKAGAAVQKAKAEAGARKTTEQVKDAFR